MIEEIYYIFLEKDENVRGVGQAGIEQAISAL